MIPANQLRPQKASQNDRCSLASESVGNGNKGTPEITMTNPPVRREIPGRAT
jgi:hypothetical protein